MKKTRKLAGRLLIFCGVALIAWPVWELGVRIDAMIGPLEMFWNMAVGEGVAPVTAIGYVDWSIFAAPALLLGYIVLGVLAIAMRRRHVGSAVLLPISALLGLYDFFRQGFLTPEPVRMLRLVPFAGVVTGCILNVIAGAHEKRRPVRPSRPKAFPLKKAKG